MRYTSIKNPKIKEIKKLQDKKYRDLTSLFLIEGEHLLLEAEKAGTLKEVFVKEGTLYKSSVEVHEASASVLQYISTLHIAPAFIGVCKQMKQNTIGNKIVILEDVQDPGNVGTILRSAVAFHADTVVLTKGCADLYSPKVIRASQGLLFAITIVICDIEDILSKVKKKGIPLLGTKVDSGKSLKNIEKYPKFAIIMGNEGSGVTETSLQACDSYLSIDMNAACESLNVGVAASLILYELDKKV